MQLTGLEDKVALITGAGRMGGIGHGVSLGLAAAGVHIVPTGTGKDPGSYAESERQAGWRDIESTADAVRELGRRALPVILDISDEAQVDSCFASIVKEFGRVDILINNAAASPGKDRAPIVEVELAAWDKVARINERGLFLMSRAFARHAIARGGGGAIINVSSLAGIRPLARRGAYSASKASMNALTAVLAQELGPHGVRVNALAIGVVKTGRMPPEAYRAERISRIPLGRPGETSDVAAAAVFLCSDQAQYITGACIPVDGGFGVYTGLFT